MDSACAKFGEYPTNLQDCPLNGAIWTPFKSDCLWASSWLTKDHERLQKDGDEKKFHKNARFDAVSVQRQVKTLIERKDAYNMQILQKWNEFRWSIITMLSDPAAKLIKDESSRVLRFHIVCRSLESGSIQQLGKKIGGRMERTQICRTNQFGSP